MRARVFLVALAMFVAVVVTQAANADSAVPPAMVTGSGCHVAPGGAVAAARRLVAHTEGRGQVELTGAVGMQSGRHVWLIAGRDHGRVRAFRAVGGPLWSAAEVRPAGGVLRCLAARQAS